MHNLKKEALSMKENLLRADYIGIVESLNMGWINKKLSASAVSNLYIEEIYNSAMETGAQAGKISGAGGGGFMLFYVNAESRMKLISKLQKFSGIISNCHFTDCGAQAWRVR